jgi:hypothetical protein
VFIVVMNVINKPKPDKRHRFFTPTKKTGNESRTFCRRLVVFPKIILSNAMRARN